MYRRLVVLVVLLSTVLQSAAAGYAMNLCTGGSDRSHIAFGAHTEVPANHHSDCCPHQIKHSVPSTCIVHCAAMVAIAPPLPVPAPAAGHLILTGSHVPWSPGERTAPGLRPPIIPHPSI